MDVSRIYRLLRIVTALQTDRYYNARDLADMLEVSQRTVYRDLECLSQAQIPYYYDPRRQGYKIPNTFFLPPMSFSIEEAMALVVLARQMGGPGGIPFQQPAVSAALKIESMLPDYWREHVADLSDKIEILVDRTTDLRGQDVVYNAILQSLARRQSVRILYNSLYEKRLIRTRLCPYRLMFRRHSWYVIGWSSMHKAVRTFNLRRITAVETLAEVYKIPARFSLERLLGNAWSLIPGDRRYTVRLHFQPQVATNVAEVRWHKTQQVQRRPDGSIDFQVEVDGLEEIYWWVLGYGDQVEVLEPPELRQRVLQTAQRVAELYAPAYDRPS